MRFSETGRFLRLDQPAKSSDGVREHDVHHECEDRSEGGEQNAGSIEKHRESIFEVCQDDEQSNTGEQSQDEDFDEDGECQDGGTFEERLAVDLTVGVETPLEPPIESLSATSTTYSEIFLVAGEGRAA
ncbi:MAG: hypothetical protein FJ280_04845 [Planctomycetes bacterium]|nr:hypothetical protein [Planctomycetota bacterium]